jgi:hypothetical protein
LKDIRPSGRFNGYLSATAGYDGNLNHSTAHSQIYVPLFGSNLTLSGDNVQRGASFAALAGGLRYTYDFDSRTKIYAGADLTQRMLSGASAFDTGAAGAYAGGALKLGRHELKAALQFTHTELAGDPDRDIAAVTGEWNYELRNGHQIALSARYAQVRQAKAGLHVFDTNATAFNLVYATPVGQRASGLVSMFAGVESNLKGNPFGEKSFFGMTMAGEYKLRHDLTASASLTMQRALWDQVNLAFQTERMETRFDFSAGLNWRFADGWSLQPRYIYNDNRSSIAIYSYRRNEFSLTLRREWD